MNIDLPIIHFKSTSPSSSSPSLNLPLSASTNSQNQALNNKQSFTCLSCSSCGGGTKQDGSSLYSAIIGSVPSKLEVESAIASLQRITLAAYGRMREALLLLQTDPRFKGVVVSLASDRALWNAIVNNEMVRKLLEDSFVLGENYRLRSSDEEVDQLGSMMRWILDIAKAKVIELIHKFQSLIDEVFEQLERGEQIPIRNSTEKVDDKIVSSLLLSVVILLIVVLARAGRA